MIQGFPYRARPDFLTPAAWLEHYEQCHADGHRTWEPATRDELLLAESSGLLALHPEWLPCRTGLRMLDLPDWFGRRQRPLSPLWQERFIQTLIDFPNTTAAVKALVMGGKSDVSN